MAQIQLPGLSTGIDTSAIVQQLMAINRMRLQARQADVNEEEEVKDALGKFDTKLSSFKSASSALAISTQLKSYNATTSDDDVMTASANYNATEGNHSVQIKQLATSDRWVHEGFKRTTSYVTAVASENFIISYDHEEMVVPITDETTLDDLVGLINNSSDNPGITASILKYDAGTNQEYHLVLSGQKSGSDYQIKINDFDTDVHTANDPFLKDTENAVLTDKLSELDGFTGTFDEDNDIITIDGTGISPVEFKPSQYSTVGDLIDEINTAFSGIATAKLDNGKIKLVADNDGANTVTITLAFDNGSDGSATLTVPGFTETTIGGTESGNTTTLDPSTTFLQTQSAQDSLIRVDDYPPATAEVQNLTNTDMATAGTFTLTYGGQTTAPPLDFNATTGDIQTALEALSTVTAGDIAVSGDQLNLDGGGTTTFTFLQSLGDVGMITINTSGLTSEGTHTLTEDTSNWISRSTNTVTDVIDGVTLNLQETTISTDGITYDDVEVTMTRNTEALKEKVEQLLTAYNDVLKFVDDNAEFDPDTKETGPLYGDSLVRTITSTLKSPFSSVASGFSSNDSFIQPSDIGIEFESDGTLTLNTNEFDEAISENYLDVLALLGATKTGETDSADIKFYGAGTATDGGTYHVEVTYSAGIIASARVKLSTEDWSDGRDIDLTDPNDVIDNGTTTTITIDYGSNNSNYPEHNLQFDTPTNSGTNLSATISVKQGFAGELKDSLANMLKSTGRIPIAIDSSNDSIDRMEDWIEGEEARLEKVEERLVAKFARLERTLSLIQGQMAMLTSM